MKVVVAMSGGVDSSVAAALLVEQGHEVVGVHMKLHDAPGSASGKTCCGLDDALDARRVADALGIPFYVSNLQAEFKQAVVDDLVQSYARGYTPSPCIQCNGVLKFRVLLSRALAMGATHLATGHYARIGEGPALRAAADPAKDQSYFLFPVTTEALQRTLFPLGELSKGEVRERARALGLVTADKAESQELCFLPEGDHASFVDARTERDGAGEIVDEQGTVLGTHDGYWRFTIGQRRGLGVALGEPAYVVRIEPETRRVVVSTDRDRVSHAGLVARGCNWFDRPEPDRLVRVRIRHRGTLVPCRVGPGEAPMVTFEEPAWAVARGQAAVFYAGDRVLGGGWIERSLDATPAPSPGPGARA